MPCNEPRPPGPKPQPPPPPPPKKGQFKVVSDARHACATTVTDAATGQPICAYAIEFSHDVRRGGRPELTIKTYQQDFEYEGPGTLFVACPKCKAEMKPPTGTGIIGQTGNKPGGSLEGMTKPPREGLYDPRLTCGPDIERHPSLNPLNLVVLGLAVAAALGFILGKVL